MSIINRAVLSTIGTLFFIGVATAAPINIRFTDPVFGDLLKSKPNSATIDYKGLLVELVAGPKKAKLTYNVGGKAKDGGGMDGIGINSKSDKKNDIDEITGGSKEMLTVNFLNTSVSLFEIVLTDLFIEDNEFKDDYVEKGAFAINGGDWVKFKADKNANNNGRKLLDAPYSNVKSIAFKARINSGSDFSLKRLKVEAVPEPGTVSLLGASILALCGLLFLRRKK